MVYIGWVFSLQFRSPLINIHVCVLRTGSRSALNDYQRSEGRELVAKPWNADRVRLIPGLTLEQCAQRCTEGVDCRFTHSLLGAHKYTHKTTHKGHTHKAYKQSQAYRLDRHAIQALDSYLFLLFPQHGANQANRANGASSLARVFS